MLTSHSFIRNAYITGILLAAFTFPSFAQGIRGEVQDSNGNPVPYAAIFIKELTRGTTCNALGMFSLRLPHGTFTIFFRSLGYTEVSRNIEVGEEFQDLVIQLPPQSYFIPEVRISASGEDPAYWIMRKTIGLANYHLHEVASYEAEIYIKGTAIIDRMPRAIARRIQANQIQVREDEAYMLESLNDVSFTAPDRYDMKVIASQNTLPGYTESVNPMDYVNASLYQQQIEGVVSPLARNAFSYYRYSFEGNFLEGTHVIDKIRVIPKRKSQQLVEGTLYIVEDLWCLHSSDLSVNTIAGTLYLQQLYANVMVDAWLPVNHKIQVDVEIAGIRGTVTYVSSLKYNDVVLNPNLPETYFSPLNGLKSGDETPEEDTIPDTREQEKISELLSKEDLSNRDVNRLSKLMEKETRRGADEKEGVVLDQTGTRFSVDSNAVKNDSLYWNSVRPIPLTPEEHTTLIERDSILGLQASVPDSISSSSTVRRRQGKPVKNLVTGKTYLRNQGRFRLTHGGLFDLKMVGYNTVDGITYGQDLRLNWRPDSLYTLRSRLTAGYAFQRKAPLFRWNSELLYAPMARGKISLSLSYISSDFNGQDGIPETTNLFYTLFLRRNYMRLYEQAMAELSNRIDLTNGLVLTTTLSAGRQTALENHSDFSILFSKQKFFMPNTPAGFLPDDPSLTGMKSLAGFIQLKYTPRHFYVIRNGRKDMRDSDWPTFSVSYRNFFPLGQTGWSDAGVAAFGIEQTFEAGLLSELDWMLDGGYFIRNNALHFSGYKHFKSSPLYVDMAGFEKGLMLLDYYEASTSDWWLHADATLTSSYLLIKFLPWFSERLWKESVGLAYLYTPGIHHYLQFGYSLRELFFLADLGVFVAFQDGAYRGVVGKLNFRF